MNIAQVKSFYIFLYHVHLTTWKANPGFNMFKKNLKKDADITVESRGSFIPKIIILRSQGSTGTTKLHVVFKINQKLREDNILLLSST